LKYLKDSPLPSRRQQAEKRGRRAEQAASLLLRVKGYSILEQRFRSKRGEIDIIARRGKVTAFIEVKARKTIEDALYSLSATQRRRIEGAAEDWLKKTNFEAGISKASLRFDIIVVVAGGIPSHITDAWRVGE
jgi:putative endonuclease